LGPGGASAVNSFLTGGCGNNAWAIGGNTVTANSVMGTNSAHDLSVKAGGKNISLTYGSGNGLRIYGSSVFSGDTLLESPHVINGSVANDRGDPADSGKVIAGGGSAATNCADTITNATTALCRNLAEGSYSVIGGGRANRTGFLAVVGGGGSNDASGSGATIGGGFRNQALGDSATVVGGFENRANAAGAVAAGAKANAIHTNSFVWGGSSTLVTNSAGVGTFTVYAPGGAHMYVGAAGSGGCILTSGAAGWACSSDRNVKANIAPLNAGDILRRVVALPVSSWAYKGSENVRNIGPMSQDFWKAFGLGDSDKTIAAMNMGGVALAAIQGLNRKFTETVQEKDRHIAALEARLKRLEARLDEGLAARQSASRSGEPRPR
jgi:trimeric autotransporter adhesin